jgi:small lipoprotein (TIGR04454 family)
MRLSIALLLAVVVAGCGRRATEADCQLIVDRSVELQMKDMAKAEPDAIAKRQVQLRQELEAQMKECVGRRISEKMMTCVKNAQSSEALEGCVR